MLLTSWADDVRQCDPIIVPRASDLKPEDVWARAVEQISVHAVGGIEVPGRDDDRAVKELVERFGLVAGDRFGVGWMDATDRANVLPLAGGFSLVDRTQRPDAPHPMRHRNGAGVETRLGQCPLYDPELDLAVQTVDRPRLTPVTKDGQST